MTRGQWDQSRIAGGRRTRRVDASVTGSPFDFSSDRDERVDPVEFLAIRADDELLGGLSTERLVGPAYAGGFARGPDAGYADDLQVLALLTQLRAEIDSVPFPPLISVDEACAAIAAGQRDRRPRRRLMSVAAAAAVATLGLTGVAVAAGNAQPGDPLWGVSTVLDGSRARSVEAAYLVNNALVTAQQALAEGRVADARVALSSVDPDLDKVADPDRKGELASRARNLHEAAEEAKDGERVPTDEHGAPSDPQWLRHRGPRAADPGGSNGDPANGSSRRATPHQQSERPNPGELFVPTKPGSPGGGAEQKPDAPANPGATNPGTANPADPGASKPGFPGFPGRPGESPGATGDPRAGRLGGDGRRDQLTKPPSAGNTANSQGCARSNAGHPNGCANPAPSGR